MAIGRDAIFNEANRNMINERWDLMPPPQLELRLKNQIWRIVYFGRYKKEVTASDLAERRSRLTSSRETFVLQDGDNLSTELERYFSGDDDLWRFLSEIRNDQGRLMEAIVRQKAAGYLNKKITGFFSVQEGSVAEFERYILSEDLICGRLIDMVLRNKGLPKPTDKLPVNPGQNTAGASSSSGNILRKDDNAGNRGHR